MNIAWATDIHLNFLGRLPKRRYAFYHELRDTNADAVLLTGDIADAPSVCRFLTELEVVLARPIYFVLGNHDFYHGSVKQVRADVRKLCSESKHLVYLPDEGPIALGDTGCLVGVDGWGDGGNGDRDRFVLLNDYDLIAEYTEMGWSRPELLKEMDRRGKVEATVAAEQLKLAFDHFTDIVFATHVPPFVEAAWHEGKHSEPAWQCGFTCRAVGALLRAKMEAHPEHRMMVVCGHTHGEGKAEILPNLFTWTAGAQYAQPRLEAVLEYA